jgi:hypothetical protein
MRLSWLFAFSATLAAGCAHGRALRSEPKSPLERLTAAQRIEAIRRAQVWAPTDIRALNLRDGPPAEGSFAFAVGETVTCDHEERELTGNTPKFYCALGKHEAIKHEAMKVRYGDDNGKTFGQVAAGRLFWALGFGADRSYSVRVVCNGCSPDPWKHRATVPGRTTVFDPAAVERKMDGKNMESSEGPGWKWPELDLVDESQGGAPRAHRDALKLLAVMVQHTDSKPDQQRLLCLPGGVQKHESVEETCSKPFMMAHDLGNTFGTGNLLNADSMSSVNYKKWSATPVWEKDPGCVANLSKSFTGTLHDPVISEAGRRFLADLLVQLSDQQIHDLFAGAQIERRVLKDEPASQPKPTVDDWVRAFKQKRDEIVSRTCPP